MNDQAHDLRRLARDAVRAFSPDDAARPRLWAIAGGKGGVGTTTLAVNLAAACAVSGARVVLVDADPDGGDAARLAGASERASLDDVLAGRRSFAESLQAGPAGLRVLPGVWGRGGVAEYAAAAHERLLGGLAAMGGSTAEVLLDVGNSVGRLAARLWQAADQVVLVITPDVASIMNGYSTVKILTADGTAAPIRVAVNLAPDPAVAEHAFGRLAEAAERFLGVTLDWLGYLPPDAAVASAGAAGETFVLAAPHCPAARQLIRLAGEMRQRRMQEGENGRCHTRPSRVSSTVA